MVEENKVSFESLPANSEPSSQYESSELKVQRGEVEVEEEEDFGDFTSVQPLDKNQQEGEVSKSSVPSLLPPLATSANQVDENAKIMDFHQLILDELADSSRVLKDGKVAMMRLGGFPKKMMRKEVSLVYIMIELSPYLISLMRF